MIQAHANNGRPGSDPWGVVILLGIPQLFAAVLLFPVLMLHLLLCGTTLGLWFQQSARPFPWIEFGILSLFAGVLGSLVWSWLCNRGVAVATFVVLSVAFWSHFAYVWLIVWKPA